MNIHNDTHAHGDLRRAHQTPDPESPPPTQSPPQQPDEYPAPTNAPVQEPRAPQPPIKA